MFLNRLQQYIIEQNLFQVNEKILLAVSGGKDSVLMAHLFNKLGYSFSIVHCNFGLRKSESDRDEEFVKKLATEFKVSFYSKKFDTEAYAQNNRISIQMAARELRYQYFENVRKENQYYKIAIAQHQNDAIETVLLNLVRGTGIAGLHGIMSNRGYIIRPLMCFNQTEIQDLIKEFHISFVEDSSNASSKYMRNYIRHKVIPELKTLNQNLEETFNTNIKYFNQLEVFLQQQVHQIEEKLFICEGSEIRISIKELKALQPIELLVYELFKAFGFNSSMVASFIKVLDSQAGKQFLTQTHHILIDRDYVFVKHLMDINNEECDWPIEANSISFQQKYFSRYEVETLSDLKLPKNKMIADASKLIYPLKLRMWKIGDSFIPFGMKKSKKLSDFFVGEKLSVFDKAQVLILVNGNGEIIWVCGKRSDERYKVESNTKKIIIFDMQEA